MHKPLKPQASSHLKERHILYKKKTTALNNVAQLDGALTCKSKGRGFDSLSGHMPRLQVWSPVGVHTGGNQWIFLTWMFLSLSLKSIIMSSDEDKKKNLKI